MLNGKRNFLIIVSFVIILLSLTMLLSIKGTPFTSTKSYTGRLSDIAQGAVSLASVSARGRAEFNMTFTYVDPVGEYRVYFNLTKLSCKAITYKISVLGDNTMIFRNQSNITFTIKINKPVISIAINAIATGPCSLQGEPMVYLKVVPESGIK